MRRRMARNLTDQRLRMFFKEHPELKRRAWRIVTKYGLHNQLPMTDLAFKVMANDAVRNSREKL